MDVNSLRILTRPVLLYDTMRGREGKEAQFSVVNNIAKHDGNG